MLDARRFLGATVPVAAMCVTLAVSTGSASASVNVVTAVRGQDQVFVQSKALAKLKNFSGTGTTGAEKLIKPIETLAGKFEHAASVVSHSSADSAEQRLGRREWSTAVRDFGAGYYLIGHALREKVHGSSSVAIPLELKGTERVTAGEKLLARADRRLGLAKGD